MDFGDVIFWPFGVAFAGLMIVIAIIFIIFWIWMIVDCAKRKFKNKTEKIIWIIAVVLFRWVGALVYFIVIRSLNPTGLARRR